MIYLYLKTHNKTGLKYLGKTEQDPFAYSGSGYLWKKHLAKHGNDVSTEILLETDDREKIKEMGLYYSSLWNVVESKDFANIIPESGDGGDTSLSPKYKEGITRRKLNGANNPMYGRSAVKENNLRWYNNGIDTIYVEQGTQPPEYKSGRIIKNRASPSEYTKSLIGRANSKGCISPKGEIFESTKAAGAAYGITSVAIRGLIKRGKSGWKFTDQL